MNYGSEFKIMGRIVYSCGRNWREAYATTCLSCISMHPNPCREASQKISKSFLVSGGASTGAEVNLLFSSWKLSSHLGVHWNFLSFLISSVRGFATLEKFSMKRRQ